MATLRQAEEAVWTAFDVTPVEHRVHLATLDLEVRVQEVGPPDGDPAVFVHGVAVAGTSWANLVAGLDGVRCLLVDRPGCGRSDPLPSPQDLDTFVEVSDRLVVDLLDAFDLSTAHVVGTSLGAHAAIRAAGRHPDRVDRLGLFGWCLGAPGARAPWWLRAHSLPGVARTMTSVTPPRGAVVTMLRRFGLGRAIDTNPMAGLAVDFLTALYADTDTLRNEMVEAPALTTVRGGWDPRLVHADDLLARIVAPTLLVWGREDPFGGERGALELARRIPDCHLHLLDRVGHAPWLDEPERTTRLLAEFLQGPARRRPA